MLCLKLRSQISERKHPNWNLRRTTRAQAAVLLSNKASSLSLGQYPMKSLRLAHIVAVLLLSMVLLLAGCGGVSSSSSTTPPGGSGGVGAPPPSPPPPPPPPPPSAPGSIVVASRPSGTVSVIDPASNTVHATISAAASAIGIAITPDRHFAYA